MANGNRLETMTIEDQLNIFAGIDVNIQVQQMSRGKMRPDVKRAIEIAMKIYNRDTGECKLAGWLKLLNININIYFDILSYIKCDLYTSI